MSLNTDSSFRIQKRRNEASVRLATGQLVNGNFFTSSGSALHAGPERIGDLLNSEDGFFPFEQRGEDGLQTVLYNRAHVVMVTVSRDEPRQEPGYDVAQRREVSMLLSTGQRVAGSIRVYQPDGHNRLSDWSRNRDQFQYLETDTVTLLVNRAHIVEVSEFPTSGD